MTTGDSAVVSLMVLATELRRAADGVESIARFLDQAACQDTPRPCPSLPASTPGGPENRAIPTETRRDDEGSNDDATR